MTAPAAPQVPGPLVAGTGVWEVFDAWLRRSTALIAESADALDALNVFPISDADTGTNLRSTLAGIARAVPDVNRASVGAVVQAAILSAHGNSGAIVAEMFSSVCRSLEQAGEALPAGPGARVALLLRTVADAARRAVAHPVAGTILTVADEAARAAVDAAVTSPDDALAVARAAQVEARAALQRTPDQLEVLAAAGGVVDAGGQAFALLVDALVEVLGGEPARSLPAGGTARPAHVPPAGPEYEVMYVLAGAGPDALAGLRERLSALGSSVVVVADGSGAASLAQVHVHTTEAGPAVEAALGLGVLSGIRVTVLEAVTTSRTVVVVVRGPGLAQVVGGAGAVPVGAGRRSLGDELEEVVRHSRGDLLVLPDDERSAAAAEALLRRLRAERRPGEPARRSVVLPTTSPVAALAALAVHDPEADLDAAVAAMSAAAGHTRSGALRPEGETGDGFLGLLGGEPVERGPDPRAVAGGLVERLLAGGAELLTVVVGAAAPASLAEELVRHLAQRRPAVEVQVLDGGQPDDLVLLGAE